MFRKQFIIPLFTATLLFGAGGGYMSKNSPLYLDASAKEAIGELVVSTEVKELSQKGEFSEIEFVGYQPKDSGVVYEKVRVVGVGLEIAKPEAIKVVGEKTDEYGTVWQTVSVKGFVPTKLIAKDRATISQAGKNLFGEKCGSCHALHAEDEFDANVWPSILDGMREQAGLSKDENDLILKYLQGYKHK